jgi:putative FmdB family regulatory protein
MPLYEYQCDACGHRFENIQKFSDPHLETCPKCGGRVHKLQSAPAIQFKGSGFYITDYAKKDQPAPATSEVSKDAGSGEKKDSGSEKKDGGGEKKDSGGEKKDGGGEKTDAATKTETSEKSSSTSDSTPSSSTKST